MDWTTRAQRLAKRLAAAGKLRSEQWRQAVCKVPRHVLVPTVYEQDSTGEWAVLDTSTPGGREHWLEQVYSEKTSITLRGETIGAWGSGTTVLSSATTPGLVVRMLEELDVHDGQRVLEIGTGSGYTTALLCHRLGDHNVFSVDIEPAVTNLARERLAAIGYTPTLVTTDGEHGLPDQGPFHRIIATCSVPALPWQWVQQLTDDGLILADVQPTMSAGNLVLLRRCAPDRLEGRFLSRWGGFMAMRHSRATNYGRQPVRGHSEAVHSTTTRPARIWEHQLVWFLAQFAMPPHVSYGFVHGPHEHDTRVVLSSPDGSWCEVEDNNDKGTRQVIEAGPQRLWKAVENAHHLWERAGQPGWEHFGLTAIPTRQTVWLDHPHGAHRWDLPQPAD